MDLSEINLCDSANFVAEVPHRWFAALREQDPVFWHEETDGPGFWAVTKYDDCVAVNRDAEHFSSAKKATFIWDMPEEAVGQEPDRDARYSEENAIGDENGHVDRGLRHARCVTTKQHQQRCAEPGVERRAPVKVRIEVASLVYGAPKLLTFCFSDVSRGTQRLVELSAGRRITRARHFEY